MKQDRENQPRRWAARKNVPGAEQALFRWSTAGANHLAQENTVRIRAYHPVPRSGRLGRRASTEINISSATLDRPIEETTATLLHEMVHEHNLENGIKDTSNNGVYHNKRFKEQAESHGLVVSHHDKYGWTITNPSEELLDFILFQGWDAIQMGERLAWADMVGTGNGSKTPSSSETGAPKPPKAKSSTRRWICPKCGTIIRSTKEVRVICADCMEMFVKAD